MLVTSSIVYRDVEGISEAASRLLRLAKLHKILPESRRIAAIRQYLELATQDEVYLEDLPRRVSCVFPQDATSDKIKEYLQEIGFLSTAPAVPARLALKGPTFLIGPCLGTLDAPQDGVLKWVSSRAEIAIQPFYQAFATCFASRPRFSCGFYTPAMATLDFERETYEAADGTITELSSRQAREMKSLFLNITAELVQGNEIESAEEQLERTKQSQQLMLLEKIPGENFLDFAIHKYADLPPFLREKLFLRLGRLALLDLVAGNLDRLVQILDVHGQYDFENASEVNLGNIMVVRYPGEIAIFAIDNEPDPRLIDASYFSFLKTLFLEDNWAEKIAQNIAQCFQYSWTQIEDDENRHMSEKQALKSIAADLATEMPVKCLCKGLKEMAHAIQTEFLPKQWKNADLLKKELHEAGLLAGIDERLQLIETLKT